MFSVHSYPDDTEPYPGCDGKSLSYQSHMVFRVGCLFNSTFSIYNSAQLNNTMFNKPQFANAVEGSSYGLTSYHVSKCSQRVMQKPHSAHHFQATN
jgi:hypothetical protein